MKPLTLASLLVLLASAGIAQEFKPFKIGLGLGYAVPGTGEGAGGGGLMYVEPGYRVSDLILVGLRLESAIIARGITGVSNNHIAGDASSNVSYTLNGQYYFNDHYVRPFFGLGFGLFALASVPFNTANGDPSAEDLNAETRFGFYPRLGLDIGHFNLTLDYNLIPRTDVPGGGEIKNSYFAIKAGFSIGGGVGKKIE